MYRICSNVERCWSLHFLQSNIFTFLDQNTPQELSSLDGIFRMSDFFYLPLTFPSECCSSTSPKPQAFQSQRWYQTLLEFLPFSSNTAGFPHSSDFQMIIAPLGLEFIRTAAILGAKIYPGKISRFVSGYGLYHLRSQKMEFICHVFPKAGQKNGF